MHGSVGGPCWNCPVVTAMTIRRLKIPRPEAKVRTSRLKVNCHLKYDACEIFFIATQRNIAIDLDMAKKRPGDHRGP